MTSTSSTLTILQDHNDIYQDAILVKPVEIKMNDFANKYNLNSFIVQILADRYEGKCIEEGYVERGSIKQPIQLSAGQTKGATLLFYVRFNCRICVLAENMLIKCKVIDIMNVGLQATALFSPSPFRIMVYNLDLKDTWNGAMLTTDSEITIRVLNVSSEINNREIQVIGEIF